MSASGTATWRLVLIGISIALLSCSRTPSAHWQDLELPVVGLEHVLDETNEHQFFSDYVGVTPEELMSQATSAVERGGYTKVCEELGGRMRGFRRGTAELGVKVDLLGGRLGLAIFDSQSSEHLLLGVCLGRYRLGETVEIQ